MQSGVGSDRQPFSEHLKELRQRLIYCLLALISGSLVGYVFHDKLFHIITRPLHQKLYYTSPLGGFNAIIKVSLIFGIVTSLPVIIYHLNRFLSPAFKHPDRKQPLRIAFYSFSLAVIGVTFGYFVSLPATLHFLTNLGIKEFQPFIVVNDYLNFVFNYLVGFAVVFQLPLVLLFINRITPQKPGHLMKYQRYVILGSFIVAAILTPTPDPLNQTLMALPMILLYQVSILIIWLQNRQTKPTVLEAIPLAPNPATPPPQPTPQAAPKPLPPPASGAPKLWDIIPGRLPKTGPKTAVSNSLPLGPSFYGGKFMDIKPGLNFKS